MRLFTIIFFAIISIQPAVSLSETDEAIWKELKKGGLVVLMRHASTAKKDNPLLRDSSCLKERKLSEKGKKEAARIGRMFKSKKVAIKKVLASPYCRTVDTAKIEFNKAQPAEFLSLVEALSQEQAKTNTEQLMETIGSYKGSANLVLVTHAPNINAVSFEMVEMGAFLVIRPMGNGEFEEIGKINLAY